MSNSRDKDNTKNKAPQKDKPKRKKKKSITPLMCAAIFVICVAGSCPLFIEGISKIKTAGIHSFESKYEDTKDKTYNDFKQSAFDYYEEKNHVSNRVSLSIGNIKEENALEVLSVCESTILISEDKEDMERWVEYPANAVYTVDMTTSEFIIDDYYKYVVIKLKTPQLNHISIDNENIVMYHLDNRKGFMKINGDVDSGVNTALEDRKKALKELTVQLENNDDNLSRAKLSTESIIRNIIKEVNPDLNLKDSDIQIEFV